MESSEFFETVRAMHEEARRRGLFFQQAQDQQLEGRLLALGGRARLGFASCSYLSLERHPALVEGVHEYVDRYGPQFSASRGYVSLDSHRELEVALDAIFGGHSLLSADAWQHALSQGDGPACSLVLSDLYPAQHRWSKLEPPTRFLEEPRTRIMLNSIHHFTPEQLRKFLRATAESADGFFAVDRTARNWREMLMTVFVVPLAFALITAFAIRPFRPHNILWGLLIPIIPLIALIDGLVSNLRSYTVDELRDLADDVSGPFRWTVGQTPGGQGVPAMTYIMGRRRGAVADAEVPGD